MSKKSDKESEWKAKVEAKLSVVNEKVTYFSYLPFFRHRLFSQLIYAGKHPFSMYTVQRKLNL